MARYVRVSARLGDRQALEAVRAELADPISDPVLLAFAGAIEEGTETVLRVLADLGSQITADIQLAEKIRTIQTQSRAANWGCFAMPYVVLVFLCATNPSYRSSFLNPWDWCSWWSGPSCPSSGWWRPAVWSARWRPPKGSSWEERPPWAR